MNNDLISREALKELEPHYSEDGYRVFYEYEIDNAPTVDTSEKYNNGYEKGYKHGYKDGLNDIRPQGEWEESHIISCGNILRMGANVIEHKCKNCGRWSIKWVRTIPDNFCPNCGLSMKKGGAE